MVMVIIEVAVVMVVMMVVMVMVAEVTGLIAVRGDEESSGAGEGGCHRQLQLSA